MPAMHRACSNCGKPLAVAAASAVLCLACAFGSASPTGHAGYHQLAIGAQVADRGDPPHPPEPEQTVWTSPFLPAVITGAPSPWGAPYPPADR
jgi:hypothetical protein